MSSSTRRGSGSSSAGVGHDSSWAPGEVPIRQRSSITLRETQPGWGPDAPPTRQYSSGSLRDSPFTLPSRRTHSSSQGSSDTETHLTSRRKTSPVESTPMSRSISPPSTFRYGNYSESETLKTSSHRKTSPAETIPTRPVSPPTVQYQGSQTQEDKPESPKSPIVVYSGSVSQKESPSSISEASTTSGSRKGSSGSQGDCSDNDGKLESCAARDISLLSREIASAYEGSLTRSDSRKGSHLLKKQRSVDKKDENAAKETKCVDKEVLNENETKKSEMFSREKSPGKGISNIFHKGHKRSASTGSATAKDESKKSGRKFSGVFSRKKSTDSEGEEEKLERRSLFPRKGSKDSINKDATSRKGSLSSAHSVSPPVTPPKRKISSPSRFFSYSSDSKTTPEVPKKFSVPGKFFSSKETKSSGESSDLDSDSSRSRPHIKRRVSLPGMLGLQRSSSAERAGANPQPLLDPALLNRRRSNFKKAQSFDVQNETPKNSMLSKLKFWDHTKKEKSPDSRMSTSPEEGRSRSASPVESSARQNSANSTEKELENKTSWSRKSRERTIKQSSLQEPGAAVNVSSQVTGLFSDKNLKVSAKVDDGVKKNGKDAKVLYVGPVETLSLSDERARKRAQYKVNSAKENKVIVTPSQKTTEVNISEPSENKVEEKLLDSNDGATRDTVSKLRERRRRRREERERFFATMGSSSRETDKTQEAQQNGDIQLVPASGKELKTTTVEANQDRVDGKLSSEKSNLDGGNSKRIEPALKLSTIGKRSTADNVLQKGSKMKGGKPRYQTIASSVHADIIADLIREKGFKSTTSNEVKIPSVAELRDRFLISKDDAKVSPTRVMLKLDERPNSVSGGVLSPTEMKKFDDITFSLAKKVSSDDIKTKRFSDSSSDSLPKLDTQWKTIPKTKDISPPSSPKVKSSSKKEEKEENVTQEQNKEEKDANVESDTLKKKRGSKKKRKISIFGTDKEKEKEPKSPEEDVDSTQHGAVSAAIKAMFTRKSSIADKSKIPRKHRTKSEPDSSAKSEITTTLIDRERKKSAPVEVAPKSLEIVDAHPAKERRGSKERVKAENKAKIVDTHPVKVERRGSKDHVKAENKAKIVDTHPVKAERRGSKDHVKAENKAKIVAAHPVKVERRGSKDHVKTDIKEEVKDVDKEKDIKLQPITELEQKSKERKSLKKRKCMCIIIFKCCGSNFSLV